LTAIKKLSVTHAAAVQEQILVIQMNNSPVYKSTAATQKMASRRITIVHHPAYSPGLAPSCFFCLDISGKRSLL
jgi:hypothetical protein